MSILREVFTWWNGQTVGTRLMTWRQGVLVGSDTQGNRYYTDRKNERRWVIYNGEIEASRIPPDWHGWMHHTVDEPPTLAPPVIKSWEQDHLPNLTYEMPRNILVRLSHLLHLSLRRLRIDSHVTAELSVDLHGNDDRRGLEILGIVCWPRLLDHKSLLLPCMPQLFAEVWGNR